MLWCICAIFAYPILLYQWLIVTRPSWLILCDFYIRINTGRYIIIVVAFLTGGPKYSPSCIFRSEEKIMTRARIQLGDVTPHNIKQLKKLNTVVFPVTYNDKFYSDVLEAGELAKLAYYNDIVVGAVCCRIASSDNLRRLYIMTLGCLYPYRRLGIGTVMFNHILSVVEMDQHFDSIFLHVQVNNNGAIAFYKKFGFEIVETKENYYKRITPADAFVLEKILRPKKEWNNVDHNNGPIDMYESDRNKAKP